MKYEMPAFATRIVLFAIVTSLLFGLSACNSKKNNVERTESNMDDFYTNWHNEDGEALIPMYSDDFIGYDATDPGWSYDFKFAETMSFSAAYWASIDLETGTFFVSPDGSYTAGITAGDYTKQGPYPLAPFDGRYPIAFILAWKDEKVVFTYNYYGGSISDTEPLLSFEKRTLDPESDEAKKAVEKSSATLLIWRTAFNERDTETFLSMYSEDALYIDVIKPDWQVMTKTELTADTTARFASSTFASELEASTKSPIPGGCFVSADGHYAAVQGNYQDGGSSAIPMLIFLEIKDGRIVKQYNFMLKD